MLHMSTANQSGFKVPLSVDEMRLVCLGLARKLTEHDVAHAKELAYNLLHEAAEVLNANFERVNSDRALIDALTAEVE